MSTPRFYSWDDDGSPGRALTGNLQNRLKQILVPCLVTGYGSKPGAGWALEHEHANGFTLSNGDAYVNFVSNLPTKSPFPAMSTRVIHIYSAESISDDTQAIINGANLCSGQFRAGEEDVSPWRRHSLFAFNALEKFIEYGNWRCLANNKTFILTCSSSTLTEPDKSTFTLYVGAFDSDITPNEANFIVLGGTISAGYQSIGSNYSYASGTALRRPEDNLPVRSSVGGIPFWHAPTHLPRTNIPASHLGKNLQFQHVRLVSDGKICGRLKGVTYDHELYRYSWETSAAALGLDTSTTEYRNSIVDIGGHSYCLAQSYYGNAFLTDNPLFW